MQDTLSYNQYVTIQYASCAYFVSPG